MNALTEIQPQSPSNASSGAMSALMLELAKSLKLVAPITMTADAQMVWLQAAVDALEGIRADEVASISAELRRTVTRPSQIVPEIAKLVAEKRKRRGMPDVVAGGGTMAERLAAQGNALLAKDKRNDVHWAVRDGQCVIEFIA
jgi:hypothetical protein